MENDKIKKMLRTACCTAAVFALFAAAAMVFATSASSAITSSMDTLKDLILTVVEAVGAIVLIYGVAQFALSFVQHDASQKVNSLYFIAAGIIAMNAGNIASLF